MYRTSVMSIVSCLILSVSAILIPTGSGLPEVADQTWVDYPQPITGLMIDAENMSFAGRPICQDPVSGNIYLAGGAYQLDLWVYNQTTELTTELYTGFTPWGDGDKIRSAICTGDYIFIVRRGNSTVYRSDDGGITFDAVHSLNAPGWGWGLAYSGSDVYVGEYGAPTPFGVLWHSPTDGDLGTWVNATMNFRDMTSLYDDNHWHTVEVDPYTGYVYAVSGDETHLIVRSTDGTNFYPWGPFYRPTAIGFDESNIYFCGDPRGTFHIYDKTTYEWTTVYIQTPFVDDSPPYDMVIGSDGVIYIRTVHESLDGRDIGIYCSPNGLDWAKIIDQSVAAPVDSDSDWALVLDSNGYVWYGDNPGDDYYHSYAYRFRDLSLNESWALVKQSEPRSVSSTILYDDDRLGWDGGRDYASFAQDLVDASLTITGVGVQNFVQDGELNNIVAFDTWGQPGWTLYHSSSEDADNLTAGFTTEKSFTGPYSVYVSGWNHTYGKNHGKLRYMYEIPADDRPAMGSTMTASFYASIVCRDIDLNLPVPGRCPTQFGVIYADSGSSAYGVIGWTDDARGLNAYWGNQTGDEWSRAWCTVVPNPLKTVRYVYFDVTIYGNVTCYLDDLQIQVGELTPCVNASAELSSEDVLVSVNGISHDFGSLDDGESSTVHLGPLSSLVSLDFDVDGSKCVDWVISGPRHAASWGCLLENDSSVLYATYLYDGASVSVWGDCTLDPASFAGLAILNPPLLGVSVPGGSTNISFTEWDNMSADSWAWHVESASTYSTFYRLSGLSCDYGYRVYLDGEEIWRQHAGPSSVVFSSAAVGDFEVVLWDPFAMWDDVGTLMLTVGVCAGVCGIFMALMRRGGGRG